MADTVDTLTLHSDGLRHIIRITNESDGTGESSVVKVDMSALTPYQSYVIKAVDVERIYGQMGGFNYVTLRWDATTDDEIAVLFPGTIFEDWSEVGLLRNPLSAGATGDIVLTTDGPADGAGYSLTLECRIRHK